MLKNNEQLAQYFYVAESSIHGRGLFARCRIARGAYIGTYHGPIVIENGDHVLWVQDDNDRWIGRDGQNLLRYLNHSKSPDAEFEGFDLFALREISPDEEITIDYGDDILEDVWPDE